MSAKSSSAVTAGLNTIYFMEIGSIYIFFIYFSDTYAAFQNLVSCLYAASEDTSFWLNSKPVSRTVYPLYGQGKPECTAICSE